MESHLLQMRGLKLCWLLDMMVRLVASFTDAWIETLEDAENLEKEKVASFTDAWIETEKKEEKNIGDGRIFYRCVD